MASLKSLVESEKADILCLQETKLQDTHINSINEALPRGWYAVWNCSLRQKGYSGTAIFSSQKPISTSLGIGQEEHDLEGRVITAVSARGSV